LQRLKIYIIVMVAKLLEMLREMQGKVIEDSRSPAGNWLTPRLERIEKGKAEMSVLIRKEMCNPFGNIHGGMMSLVIDEAIGWAIVSLEAQQHYTSVSLNIDFLYAAAEGERITAIAEIIRQGKKIINAEVRVFNEHGVLLSKATSNLVSTGMQLLQASTGQK
jgi:acyl-coenzyme A thioesterase 13